jgi:hypothetical protein
MNKNGKHRKDGTMITQTEILQHALVGYQAQRDDITRRIEDLERRLNGGGEVVPGPAKPKRQLSAKGRAAISRAAKDRWRRARAAGRRRLG